jgi:Flp pilus assembly protein TadG
MDYMRKQKGQAILELTLVLPIILIIFCAIVDFGRILHSSTQLNLVAQEAVRLGGLGKSDSEVASFVKDKSTLTDKDAINVELTPEYINRKSGDYLTLKITYEVKYITPLMNIFLPSPYIIAAESTIRVE